MTTLLFLLVLASVCFQAFSQILLRRAMIVMPPLPAPMSQPIGFALTLARNPWLWAGLISCVVSVGLWLVVLARVPVSVAYPMLSIGYVIAAVIGVLWLGETMTWLRVAGMLIIVVGVVVISRSA